MHREEVCLLASGTHSLRTVFEEHPLTSSLALKCCAHLLCILPQSGVTVATSTGYKMARKDLSTFIELTSSRLGIKVSLADFVNCSTMTVV